MDGAAGWRGGRAKGTTMRVIRHLGDLLGVYRFKKNPLLMQIPSGSVEMVQLVTATALSLLCARGSMPKTYRLYRRAGPHLDSAFETTHA